MYTVVIQILGEWMFNRSVSKSLLTEQLQTAKELCTHDQHQELMFQTFFKLINDVFILGYLSFSRAILVSSGRPDFGLDKGFS